MNQYTGHSVNIEPLFRLLHQRDYVSFSELSGQLDRFAFLVLEVADQQMLQEQVLDIKDCQFMLRQLRDTFNELKPYTAQ
ncbi:hypothetical protein GCM10027578_22120 [Spirosoma luteolum]